MATSEERPLDLMALVNAEAWLDPEFKAQLEADTDAAMRRLADKHGLELPQGVQYSVVNNTETVQHVVLWPDPSGLAPAEEASEVQGYALGFSAPSTGPVGFWTSTKSYVCTAVYTTCSHHCPKRIATA